MGWTSYQATHYDKRGNIDRKAECDSLMNNSTHKVLKSSIKGSIYYAALKYTEDFIEKYPNYKDAVFAVVIITSVDNKDPYFNFSYKDMDESMGPCFYDCPLSILNLLTPTDSEFANQWRDTCRIRNKKLKEGLSSMSIGSTIEITMPFDTISYAKGERVILTKEKYGKRAHWYSTTHRFSTSLMKRLEEENNYKIIEVK